MWPHFASKQAQETPKAFICSSKDLAATHSVHPAQQSLQEHQGMELAAASCLLWPQILPGDKLRAAENIDGGERLWKQSMAEL